MKKILTVIFILLVTFTIIDAKTKQKKVKNSKLTKNHNIIINFNRKNPKKTSGWIGNSQPGDIYRWGRAKGLFLVNDMGPVVDNWTAFISENGAKIQITGLRPDNNYYLWIDFVKFKYYTDPKISSRLEITIDNRSTYELVFGKINTEKLYKIEIPKELTYDGKINIEFEEFAHNKGIWGIWDLIITNKENLKDANIKNIVTNKKNNRKLNEKKQKVKTRSKKQRKIVPGKAKKIKSLKNKKKKKPIKVTPIPENIDVKKSKPNNKIENKSENKNGVIKELFKGVFGRDKKKLDSKQKNKNVKKPTVLEPKIKGPKAPVEPGVE